MHHYEQYFFEAFDTGSAQTQTDPTTPSVGFDLLHQKDLSSFLSKAHWQHPIQKNDGQNHDQNRQVHLKTSHKLIPIDIADFLFLD